MKLPLEPWMSIRLRLLKEEFGEKEFSKEEVVEFLEKKGKGLSNVNEFLATLVKAKYLKTKQNPTDARKTIYSLLPEVESIGHVTRDKLIPLLKSGANLIRLRVDYRVLLVLLFYKSLSDHYNKKVEEVMRKEGLEAEDAYHLVNIEYYYLYDEAEEKLYTWDDVVKDKVRIISNFVIALNKIADMNDQIADLKILVEKLGLNSLLNNEDNYHIFLDLVDLYNKVDFADVPYDVLGAAYEWILSYFASLNIKEGGLYTPNEITDLMVKVLDIEAESDILDPACGPGGMLNHAHAYVSKNKHDGKSLKLEGQEQNDVTAILGKLNLLLRNIYNYKVHNGDSLINPKFKQADYVLANPPWNQNGYDDKKLNREDLRKIYHYGMTTKQSADWAWVQLMLHFAKKKVAVVLDSGALFRGGKEEAIRSKILNEDLIEAVILLPQKLFYNTAAPGIILLLDKNKPEHRENKVFFVNMSKTFIKHPEIRKLNGLSDENIKKCVEAVIGFKAEEGFAKDVELAEIEENDFSLNVSLYVYPEDDAEEIDLQKEFDDLKKLQAKEDEIGKKVDSYVEKILKVAD